MDNKLSTHKKYIVPILIIVSIIMLGFLLVFGFINGRIADFFDTFWQILAPITTGFVIAYLSNPLVMLFEKRIFKWIPHSKLRRFLSILIAFSFILLFIILVLIIVIPSIIETLISFWETYVVNYKDAISNWVISLNSRMDEYKFLDSVNRLNPESIINWVESKLPWISNVASGDLASILPNLSHSLSHNISIILEYIMSFGTSLINILKNLLLGIFIAFYMLMAKERCKAYTRRFLNSFLKPKKVRAVIRFGKLVDRSFGGFIEGQLIDAIVVGFISFFTFTIFGLPVPQLLATIIAVTNVIPIFGPFIGGIPASFIVLLTAPEKAILFVLLIFIIQQIDGNIICPHIIGDKIHISSLATIIAIITMGGLFGVLGLIIGVPIFAVVIHIINDYTMNSLRKKKLPTSLKDYYVGDPEIIYNANFSFKKKFKSIFSSPQIDDEKDNIENNKEK